MVWDVCIQAGRRWCLSGTPIQNSVDDLYSCFRFLRYNPYCKRAAFKTMLKDPLQDDPLKGAQLLQVCLKVSQEYTLLSAEVVLHVAAAELQMASKLVDSDACNVHISVARDGLCSQADHFILVLTHQVMIAVIHVLACLWPAHAKCPISGN